MPRVIEIPDPDEGWAMVELYRWQHGHLPNEPGKPEQRLSVPEGLRGMAKAINDNPQDQTKWPTPFNIAIVLRYVATLLDNKA